MKIKHTLGPWKHEKMLLPPRIKDRRCGFIVNASDGNDCVPWGIWGFSEGDANARLIASAPELLEALEACLPWVSDYNCSLDDAEQAKEAMAKARAAISKATGA
jgi:hypothetical protein